MSQPILQIIDSGIAITTMQGEKVSFAGGHSYVSAIGAQFGPSILTGWQFRTDGSFGPPTEAVQFNQDGTASFNGMIPIGGIIPWHKSALDDQRLHSSWIECTGGTVGNVKSPIYGKSVPNLNGDNRFIRGNSTSNSMGGSAIHVHSFSVNTNGPSDFTDIDAQNPNGTVASAGHAHLIEGETDTVSHVPPYVDMVYIMRIL